MTKKNDLKNQPGLVDPQYLQENIDVHHSANEISCWTGGSDYQDVELATKRLKEMFVEMGQKTRIERGQMPAQRGAFRKQHGIVYGHFDVLDGIDDELKVGIFGQKNHYECIVRFSSDVATSDPDLKSTLGVGIKLFGVKGQKLIGEGNTADFIMQNIDRFFAKDASQMCAFTTAGVVDHDYPAYLAKHADVQQVLTEMTKEEGSTLSAEYWAILPFKFGHEKVVKYRLRPVDTYRGAPTQSNDYLKEDLVARLQQGSATFQFEIQFRTNPEKMPLDDAQVVWSTKESPYIPIATLTLPKQDITAIGQAEYGSNLAFNIWRTTAAHEPLGSIAHVRKAVYEASAKTRFQANGLPIQEPNQVNLSFEGNTDEEDDCIVTAGIYPPIGVMRVGGSKDYFIGPEVPNPLPRTEDHAYRDEQGLLKRQAAKFRIYGFNAAGKAVKELTMDNAKIVWHSHLANQKSSWYEFQIALDIPEAKNAAPSLLRNNDVADRSKLLIDGGKQSVNARNAKKGHEFVGYFMDQKVYLGEMHTDAQGRLLMLGGHGVSRNVNGDIAITFANNSGWHDDISDGPVTAEVEYQGVQLQVDPAWVICAPPDYAPMQKSVRTMWDLMRSVAVNAGMLTRPERPSFKKDILPIFERMTNLQWVNAGFAAAFGHNGAFNYTTPEWIARLGNPSLAYTEMRRTISNNFRRFGEPGADAPQLWPWLYGDAISIPTTGSERQHATLSELQLSFLEQWVKGDFIADYVDPEVCPHAAEPTDIDNVPVAKQPDTLTRAAMEFCLADAFHPGCEMTWPMRTADMYMKPFRLKHSPRGIQVDTTYYGAQMNVDTLTLAQGPLLGGQVPGGITRWMAIPWQTDTASCRDGYTSDYDPYLPTFWPARVPNTILNEQRYAESINPELDPQTRLEAFHFRTDWLDDLPLYGQEVTYTAQINSMIYNFNKLAVVQGKPGVDNDPNFPNQMQVAVTPDVKTDKDDELLLVAELAKKLISGGQGGDKALPKRPQKRSRFDLGVVDKVTRFNKGLPKLK
ncbi:LodA/GoxA family CTQ-dependent oxidase [Vibrio nitrifigilis]|uniref:LodA/GoxA family CTQ-dependent oxidase n=1 Tax=Vibrio nitrifigilis TaxID=2789781 RepID=A0ABS0GD46_9VIBR|nr:LodA/GoxA family CTQ-dependent oxidase [Vibrio nitrifigilis]MBF9000341.1 LodA/GoxA family CTQ-dependent oxidase [Vibrio nitrifigilis]